MLVSYRPLALSFCNFQAPGGQAGRADLCVLGTIHGVRSDDRSLILHPFGAETRARTGEESNPI